MKPYEMRHERRLAALAQGQKPDGLDCYFVEIAQQFRPYMHSIALSILGNQDSAEDAVSDALLKAYVNLYGFTPEERESLKARAWLAEIVRNVCIDCRNNRKEEESLDLLMQTGYQVIAPPYQRPENWALLVDALALIEKCLGSLSSRDREIVRRYVMLGEPAAGVANDLGISKTTLYTATYRAIAKLRHPHLSRPLTVKGIYGESVGLVLDC